MRILCFCLFVLCSVAGHAEDGRQVRCRFLCLDGAQPPPSLVNVSGTGAEITCTIPPNGFSPVTVCFAKDDVIRFLTAEDLKPAATAAIPAAVTAAVLVFGPADKAPDALPWRVSVIEDFAADFPDGGALVANLCVQDIRFIIDDTPVTLLTGKSHRFARPEKRDAFNMATVVFQFQQDGAWRTASESVLRFVPGIRYLFFSYLDPLSGRPRIATWQDFPAPPAAPRK